MKSKMLGLFLLLASPVMAGGFFIGFGGGRPYRGGYGDGYYSRPPIVNYAPPVYSPYAYGSGYYGPEYGSGYYGQSYYGSSGYVGAPPFAGAIWVGPRNYRGRYTRGYWRHR